MSVLTYCLLLSLVSCVSQSIPTHGGGKRFFYEQALVTMSVDDAMAQLDLAPAVQPIQEPTGQRAAILNVYVIAMGDEGGGLDPAGGFLSAFGLGGSSTIPASVPSSAVGIQAPISGATDSASHAFANARDLEYVRARVVQTLTASGARIAGGSTSQADRDVYIVVSQFGTAKSGFNLLVYTESALAARTVMDGFCIERGNATASNLQGLGRGSCTTEYLAQYIFGFGPIGGAEISITPGALPVRIKRNAPREEGDVQRR